MSLAAHKLGAYNPRQRYLSGMGAYNPRTRYLTGLSTRALTGLGIRGMGLRGMGCARCVSPLGQDIDAGALDDPLNLLTPDAGTPGLIPGTVMAPGDVVTGTDITSTGYGLPSAIPAQSGASPIIPLITAAVGAAPAIAYAAGKSPYPSTLPPGIVAAQPNTVGGIPTNYLIYGGLALVALVALGGMKR